MSETEETTGDEQVDPSTQPEPSPSEADTPAQEEASPETDPGLISQDEIDQLLSQAGLDVAESPAPAPPLPGVGSAQPFQLDTFQPSSVAVPDGQMDLLMDVNLQVEVILGTSTLPIEQVIQLREGSVVTLDRLAGDPLTIMVNDRPIAKGEVLVLDDNFCIRITEIRSPDERQPSSS